MEPINSATSEILKNGLLGAIVIVLGIVVIYLYKEVQQSKCDRLNDWINHSSSINQTVVEVKVFMQRIIDLLQQGKTNV